MSASGDGYPARATSSPAMADSSTMSTASTSIMPIGVRYRLPALTWWVFHRRKVTVTDPSATGSRKRCSKSTTTA